MGLELISQPQVFLAPITAFGGIQNGPFGDVVPPFYTSFYTWTSTSTITATVFPLDGVEVLTNKSASYIVTVGGVVQSPTNYAVDPIVRTLAFDFTVNPDTPIVVTQIGTVGVSSQSLTDLTATNSFLTNITANFLQVTDSLFDNITATRLTVLTSTTLQTIFVPTSVLELTAINTAQFLNSISVFGDVSATGTVFASGGNSNLWNYNTTLLQTNSANWESTYATVCSLSASWEESADILPTVTNYLSTSNVLLSGLTTESITVTSNEVFGTTSYVNTVSALAITVNGTVLYLPLLSAV